MLKIFINREDVTKHYVNKSMKIGDQLKNRSNRCNFTMNDFRVFENQIVDVWDAFRVKVLSPSGSNTITVHIMDNEVDNFEKYKKFKPGRKLFVCIGDTSQREYTIQSTNYATGEITFEENFFFPIPQESLAGFHLFSGVTQKVPEEETSFCDNFTQKVSCTDYKKLLDRKNVAEIFENEYTREIFGRIIYEFAATDTDLQIDPMEVVRTESGTAGTMTLESVDRIFGNESLKGSVTTGIGAWTQTYISEDYTQFSHFRFWWKVPEGQGAGMDKFTIKLGNDSSNYYTYDIPRIGLDFEDCWNYEAIKIFEMDGVVGSPDLTAITYVSFEFETSSDVNDMLFDQIVLTTGGFTLTDTIRGDRKFVDVRVNNEKISETITKIVRLNQEDWALNIDRDISYFVQDDRPPAPIEVTESSRDFGKLIITPDTKNLRNRQLVLGGEAPEPVEYTQTQVSDGEEESYRLDYKFENLSVFVDTGSGFVSKTVGVENVDSADDFEFMANFQEKIIKLGGMGIKLNAGEIIKYTYFPFKPISYRYDDPTSVSTMKALTGGDGIYDGEKIIDRTIKTQEEAFLRAKAEVEEFKNPTIDCTFVSNVDGFKAGQLVKIVDSNRNIDDTFMIQRVSISHKGNSFYEYSILAASTLFGLTEFLQMILRRSLNLFLDEDSLVFVVKNQDETITLQEVYELTKKDNDFLADEVLIKNRDFVMKEGSISSTGRINPIENKREGFINGGEVGTISFDAPTLHNNNKCLQFSPSVGGESVSMIAQDEYLRPMKPSTNYEVKYRASVLSSSNPGDEADVKVIFEEYDAGGVFITANELSSGIEIKDFDHYELQFTSNINTNFYRVKVLVNEVAGQFQIADIKLRELAPFSTLNPALSDFSEAS